MSIGSSQWREVNCSCCVTHIALFYQPNFAASISCPSAADGLGADCTLWSLPGDVPVWLEPTGPMELSGAELSSCLLDGESKDMSAPEEDHVQFNKTPERNNLPKNSIFNSIFKSCSFINQLQDHNLTLMVRKPTKKWLFFPTNKQSECLRIPRCQLGSSENKVQTINSNGILLGHNAEEDGKLFVNTIQNIIQKYTKKCEAKDGSDVLISLV